MPLIYEQDWVGCHPVSWQQMSINIVPKEILVKMTNMDKSLQSLAVFMPFRVSEGIYESTNVT